MEELRTRNGDLSVAVSLGDLAVRAAVATHFSGVHVAPPYGDLSPLGR